MEQPEVTTPPLSDVSSEAPPDYLYRVVLFFGLLFGSYFAMANQLTSLLGAHGFFILATLNFSFTLSCFFGGIAVKRLGKLLIFICGGFAFNIMNLCAAIVVGNKELVWTLYIAAFIVGIFGSWLWVAQGGYVAVLFKPARQGYGFGLFNALFAVNGIIGFGLLLVSASLGVDSINTMWILFAISVLATVSAFNIKKWPVVNSTEKKMESFESIGDEKQQDSVCQQILNVVSLTYDKQVFYQALFALWAGHTEGMYWTTIAAQYRTAQLIAICFLTQSTVSLFASFILGIISDKYGRFSAMSFCLIMAILTNICSGVGMDMADEDSSVRWGLLITGAVGFGCSDFPGQALLRANYQAMFPNDASRLSDAMANLLMILMFGTLFATLSGVATHPWVSVIINTVFAFMALIGQYCLPKHVNRKLL
jgi:MFS family permease